jgi:hypothetical protein
MELSWNALAFLAAWLLIGWLSWRFLYRVFSTPSSGSAVKPKGGPGTC